MAEIIAGKGGTFYPPFPVLGLASDGKQIFLTGGGGGASASKEVPNVVQAHRYIEATGQLSCIASLSTDKSVVVHISQAAALGLWLATTQAGCKVLELSEQNNTLTQVSEFASETEGKDPQQNVARLSADGRLLATGGTDGIVRIWTVVKKLREEPTLLHATPKAKEVLDLDFSADGKLLASCDRTLACTIWDTATGQQKVVLKYEHAGPPKVDLTIRGIRFFVPAEGAQPQLLVAAAAPRGPACLGIYQLDGKRVKQVKVHQKPLTALSLDAAGKRAAVNLVTGGKKVYSLPGLSCVKSVEAVHELPAPCAAFLGEATVVSGSGDRSINLMCFARGPLCGFTLFTMILVLLTLLVVAFLSLRIGIKGALLQGGAEL